MNVYEIVTDRIIKKLEQGTIPWRKPWSSRSMAVNWKSQKPYRGVNAFLLDAGEYATFNQIQEAGGKIKKGAKSSIVVFYKKLDIKDEETDEEKKIPFLRYYNVWEINTQCEGMESKREIVEEEADPIAEAEAIVKGYKEGPEVRFAPGRAYYSPSADYISVPALEDYKVPAEYYSTLFHEMAHSTGHKSRLNREEGMAPTKFGSDPYSREELVAETAAAMLCGVAGIEMHTLDNSAAYIQSWLKRLKEDSRYIVKAASAAQKAADHILGVKWEA